MKKIYTEEDYTTIKQKSLYLSLYYCDLLQEIAKDFNNNESKAIRYCLNFYYSNRDLIDKLKE